MTILAFERPDAVATAGSGAVAVPAQRFVWNSGATLGSQILLALLSLATTPYIIGHLGADRYGVFAFLVVFAGYLSYLDLGLGWALIKFVAEHEARRDDEGLRRSVGTALLAMVSGAVLASVVLVLATDWIVVRFLRLPPALAAEARIALWLTAVSFVLNAAMGTFNSVLKGLHRFDITSLLQTAFGSAAVVGSVWALHVGYGLPGVMTAYAATSLGSLVAHVVVLRHFKPDLPLLPYPDLRAFRRMFSFSVFTTINKVCITGLFQADKLLVAYFLPVASLSYYSIAFNTAQKLSLLATNTASVMFPLASHQFATTDRQRYRLLYRRAAKVVFFVTTMGTIVLIAFARPFLRAWLGPEFEARAAAPLGMLAIAFCAVSVSSIEAVSIEGAGRPRVLSAFLAIVGAVNISLCVVLIPRYGILGAAAALAASLSLLAVMNIAFFNLKLIGSTMAETLKENYGRSLAVLVFAALGTFLLARIQLDGLATLLATMAAAGTIGCAVGLWPLLGRETQKVLKSVVLARPT